MIEHQHQVIGIAIAVSALADGAHAGIVAFEGSVGQVVVLFFRNEGERGARLRPGT